MTMSHTEVMATPTLDSGVPWKMRVEEPLNRYVNYPLARWLVSRLLVRTPITPNQVTLVQPLLGALAGFLVTFDDWRTMVGAALVYQTRSVLDCADGTLARAKNMATANGHALDGLCDWLSAMFLYAGIYVHFVLHPPAAGPWTAFLPAGFFVAMVLVQGGLRSFAADYYLRKYQAIFATGQDRTIEELIEKVQALESDRSFTARAEAFILRQGHFCFEQERFDPDRSRPLSDDEVGALVQARDAPLTRFVAALWTVSNGDFFITMSVLGILFGLMWEMVVFQAVTGVVWVVLVVAFNGWFIRRTARRAALAPA